MNTPSYILIESSEYFEILHMSNVQMQNYEYVEIIRQVIQFLDYGSASIKSNLGKIINFNLLFTNFTDEQKKILNYLASDILIRLYNKCCELGMFLKNNTNNNIEYFPYYVENIDTMNLLFICNEPLKP